MSARSSRRAVVASALACMVAGSAAAADEFYRGKTLTLILGYAPGGGVDTAGRVIARHFARFVPGNPSVIVQNMEGAAGMVSANYLDRKAAPDGLTVAVPGRSWHVEGLIRSPGALFDVSRLSYVGSTGTQNSFAWVRADTGIRSYEDLRQAKNKVVFAALGPSTPTAMIPALLAANGAPIKLVVGYTSSSRLIIAMEQGEAPAAYLTEDSFALHQNLIERKFIIPILQSKPDVPGLTQLRDVIPERQRPLMELARSAESVGLMMVAPPGVPADRLAILRDAFFAMANDPEYQADVARFESTRTSPLRGEAVEKMMKDLASLATPDIIGEYNKLKN
jgi:tripartite-type tricarboxylate transporter receptor subunit TctC